MPASPNLGKMRIAAEVLSDSTEAYDRGRKFAQYRLIPSLRHYVLVSQKEPRIELLSHAGGDEWRWRESSSLEGLLELPALEIGISLSEVFSQVVFNSSPPRLRP